MELFLFDFLLILILHFATEQVCKQKSCLFQLEQINQEYKVRALQFHPDKHSGDKEMEEKFQLLNVSTNKI